MVLVVHTSAFTAHRSVIPGKLWFVGNFNSNMEKVNFYGVLAVGYEAPLSLTCAEFREKAT